MITGKRAEEIFKDLMINKGFSVRKSTEKEDMFDHIDFFVDEVSYDVKGQKKYDRQDDEPSDQIWLETVNVRGNTGWVYGKAQFIAFLIKDEFWIIPRVDLVTYIEQNITNQKIYKHKGYKKWYRREGRMDCITYVYPRDLEKIVSEKFGI